MGPDVGPDEYGGNDIEISGTGDDGVGASFVTLAVSLEDFDQFIADLYEAKLAIEERDE